MSFHSDRNRIATKLFEVYREVNEFKEKYPYAKTYGEEFVNNISAYWLIFMQRTETGTYNWE